MSVIEEVNQKLAECFLYWGNGHKAVDYLNRLTAVHNLSQLEAQQLVVDEMKAGRIGLTDQLELWLLEDR